MTLPVPFSSGFYILSAPSFTVIPESWGPGGMYKSPDQGRILKPLLFLSPEQACIDIHLREKPFSLSLSYFQQFQPLQSCSAQGSQ